MSISEQVKELRRYVEAYEKQPFGREVEGTVKVLSDAADTIESLSVKLQAADMEPAEDCDGWIPCKERLPENDGVYLATIDGEIAGEDKPFSGLAEFENGKWIDDEDDYQFILAWKPLPEPYHEP